MKTIVIMVSGFLVSLLALMVTLQAEQEIKPGRKLYNQLVEQALPHVQQEQKKGRTLYNNLVDEAMRDNQDVQPVDAPEKTVQQWPVYSDPTCDISCPEPSERQRLISLAVHVDFTNKAFDASGSSTSLGAGVFGSGIQLKDIFLLSRLSYEGLLFLQFPPIFPPNQKFGNTKDQQYLNFLAVTMVNFGLSQRVFNADITGMYRMCSPYFDDAWLTIGFIMPIKYQQSTIDLVLDGGKLYQVGYTPLVAPRETTLTQFFKDFISVEDFFIRAVLEPKGISFNPQQNKIGFGDLTLFAILDFAEYLDCADGLQVGINLVTPTAHKATGNTLWQVELGNGGATLIDIFSNALLRSCSDYFNPSLEVGFEFGAGSYSTMRRIPQIKTHTEGTRLRDNSDLIRVPIFTEYFAQAFTEIDSFIPAFADSATRVRIKQGTKLFAGAGNYFYNVFSTCARLGVYYDYLRKSPDKIIDAAPNMVTSLVTGPTKSTAHRIGWNYAFVATSGFEFSFGSQHIIAGTNVPKLNEFFVVWSAVF